VLLNIMKVFPFSALSFDIDSSDPCSSSSSKRSHRQPDITPEQKAGQEIQNILLKRSRPDLMTCAAPLPRRVPLDYSEDELDVFEDAIQPSACCGETVLNRWFVNSPTQIPAVNADGSHASDFAEPVTLPCHILRNVDAAELPTTIVGTPPCRSGNPLVNDSHFLHMQRHDPGSQATSSAIGSELGLFRLSPSAF